jgi:hypothetical protein
MKKLAASLILILGVLMLAGGCNGANEVTGPQVSQSARPLRDRTIASADSRMHPVAIPRPQVAGEVVTRPPRRKPKPTPGPCYVPGSLEQKNGPCEPCQHTVGLQRKNKPCYED